MKAIKAIGVHWLKNNILVDCTSTCELANLILKIIISKSTNLNGLSH